MAIATSSGVAPFSFTIKQGSDLSISMTWLDDNGNPVNLTGYSMKLSIRRAPSTPAPILTLLSSSMTGSRIVLGGTAGTIDLIFSHADTVQMAPAGLPLPNSNVGAVGVYQIGFQDLQYTDASGNVGYLFEGPVYLDPQVTQ
jgi:hypothetical protein